MTPLLSEQKKLIEEILSSLESDKDVSPLYVLRKAVRLAEISNEPEFRLLFQYHIDGWSRSFPRRTSAQKWNVPQKPKWDALEVAMEDRTNADGMVQGLSILEIEEIRKNIQHDIDQGFYSEDTFSNQSQLLAIYNRINARVAAYTVTMQKRILESKNRENDMKGTNDKKKVFIGHGRSFLWRDLKDFLQDRLMLDWDEFNRESPSGLTVVQRLEDMLSKASFAFIVMTAEDEHSDGSFHARENVIHEAGLFQGKLGFKKAILLLEDGCSEFSNIEGLTQIRFPKGNILTKSEEIRRVLERESLL